MSAYFRPRSGVWLQEPPSLPLTIFRKVVRRVVSPAATALRMFPLGRESTGDYAVCVQKRWQRFNWNGLLGAMYDYTEIRKQQISVSYRIFYTPWPRATDTMKFEVGGWSFMGSWSQWPDRRCVNPRNRIFRDSSSSRTTLSCLPLRRFFSRRRKRLPSGPVNFWKLTPSFPSREHFALNQILNP